MHNCTTLSMSNYIYNIVNEDMSCGVCANSHNKKKEENGMAYLLIEQQQLLL